MDKEAFVESIQELMDKEYTAHQFIEKVNKLEEIWLQDGQEDIFDNSSKSINDAVKCFWDEILPLSKLLRVSTFNESIIRYVGAASLKPDAYITSKGQETPLECVSANGLSGNIKHPKFLKPGETMTYNYGTYLWSEAAKIYSLLTEEGGLSFKPLGQNITLSKNADGTFSCKECRVLSSSERVRREILKTVSETYASKARKDYNSDTILVISIHNDPRIITMSSEWLEKMKAIVAADCNFSQIWFVNPNSDNDTYLLKS